MAEVPGKPACRFRRGSVLPGAQPRMAVPQCLLVHHRRTRPAALKAAKSATTERAGSGMDSSGHVPREGQSHAAALRPATPPKLPGWLLSEAGIWEARIRGPPLLSFLRDAAVSAGEGWAA